MCVLSKETKETLENLLAELRNAIVAGDETVKAKLENYIKTFDRLVPAERKGDATRTEV